MEDDKKVHEKGTIGWVNEQLRKAKKDGFENLRDWNNWKREQRWYKELEDKYGKEFVEWARENKDKVLKYYIDAGCKNRTEYGNKCLQKLGYKDEAERQLERLYNKGIISPMSENEDCSYYFGTFIGEKLLNIFLSMIFEYVKGFNPVNEDFDFICKNPKQEFIDKYPRLKLVRGKEYTIQLKLRCIRTRERCQKWYGWDFTHIDYNNVPDYFILVGCDNRESLQLMHIWIFHKDDMVRKGHSYTKREKFWKRSSFTITNTLEKLGEFEKYELIDELCMLEQILKKLKEDI